MGSSPTQTHQQPNGREVPWVIRISNKLHPPTPVGCFEQQSSVCTARIQQRSSCSSNNRQPSLPRALQPPLCNWSENIERDLIKGIKFQLFYYWKASCHYTYIHEWLCIYADLSQPLTSVNGSIPSWGRYLYSVCAGTLLSDEKTAEASVRVRRGVHVRSGSSPLLDINIHLSPPSTPMLLL